MREKIAEIVYGADADWTTKADDYLVEADLILALIREEIEKVEAGVEAANPREEPEYYRGCGDACDRILALLRSK